MAKPRKIALESPTARAKLTPRKKSYFVRVAPHVALGYRRNQSGFGTWSVRFADGSANWLKSFGIADDLEPANDKTVFNYDQAIKQARVLARGEADTETPATGSAPVTVGEALDAYEADLKARGDRVYNARGPRRHLGPQLLGKPVATLDSKILRKWRDGLLDKELQPSSVVRYAHSLAAALNLAASHDQRIINGSAWKIGLQSLPNASVARNVILDDATVSRFIAAAYAERKQIREEEKPSAARPLAACFTRAASAGVIGTLMRSCMRVGSVLATSLAGLRHRQPRLRPAVQVFGQEPRGLARPATCHRQHIDQQAKRGIACCRPMASPGHPRDRQEHRSRSR
jgi:hypothetical protein